MNLEQQKALALAQARRRRAEAEGAAASAPRSGPWEKYATPAPARPGPWSKYAQPTNITTPTSTRPTVPAVEPSLVDIIMGGASKVGGVLDQGARGVAQGVTNMIGLPRALMEGKNALVRHTLAGVGVPEDTADTIANLDPSRFLLPSAEGMQRAGDSVNNMVADALGLPRPDPTPDNLPERFANRIGQEVGGAAIPTAGVVGKAERMISSLGDAAPAAARAGGKLSRMLLEPAVVNPGRYVAREIEMATAAGVGASTANEISDSPYADFVGAVLGAVGAGTGARALRNGGEILSAISGSPRFSDDVVRSSVSDRLVNAAGLTSPKGEPVDTTDLVNTIMNGPRLSDSVPGVKETLADRTRNPSIAALEYGRQSGPGAAAFNTRRQQNNDAINSAITGLEPPGNPAMLRSELSIERDRRLTDANVNAANAQDEAARTVQPLTPKGTAATRGNLVRSALEDAREAARSRTETAYGAANITGQPIQPSALINAIEAATERMPQADQANLPEILISRLQRIGNNPATMAEATALRSELQQMGVAASRRPGGRNEARVLGQVEAAVDDFIFANLPPDQQSALRSARTARFAEGQSFDRMGDPVQGALAQNDAGYKLRDENVAGNFTRPQAMDRLFKEADTPATRAAIRDELLSGADVSRAERIQNFITTNDEALDRFPGLKGELSAAAKAREGEAAAAAQRAELERALGTDERPGRSTVGRYLQFSDANSERAVREVLSAKDPRAAADELLSFVGDEPGAVEGARKALWENMAKNGRRAGETTTDMSGVQEWMPKKLKRWLDDPRNSAVAERFYRSDPQHLANIRKLVDSLQGLDLRFTAKAPATSGTPQAVLPTTETLGAYAMAHKRGQVGLPFLGLRIGATVARRSVKNARADALDKMLDDALLNPDTAALLLKENNPANRAALSQRAKNWFGAEATPILNALTADDETELEKALNDQ